jgi:hypothetical protein
MQQVFIMKTHLKVGALTVSLIFLSMYLVFGATKD